jgi:predicted nuclease of predicted toxin-antitoxin system
MRIIIDENVSYGVAERLRMGGYGVISISEKHERGMSDEDIYALILEEEAVLITRDYHFTNPIRFHVENISAFVCHCDGRKQCGDVWV